MDKTGGYAAYDKNNKEREADDFYSTPTVEVVNILKTIKPDLKKKVILEPGCGDGSMIRGILEYEPDCHILGIDIKDRRVGEFSSNVQFLFGEDGDYLCNRNFDGVDWVIMNPPFSLNVPFVDKSLHIAKNGVIMFNRLKFIESKGRYEKIFRYNPPTTIYGYVDRVSCLKNGKEPSAAIEANAWFYWDKAIKSDTIFKWIRRA